MKEQKQNGKRTRNNINRGKREADWIVDPSQESGEEGGRIIAGGNAGEGGEVENLIYRPVLVKRIGHVFMNCYHLDQLFFAAA